MEGLQTSLFSGIEDDRPPETVTWNLWHGCTKVSPGCMHCYVYRRDASVGRDASEVTKTRSFGLPVRKIRSGMYRDMYKVPSGSMIYTCFSSDFFHADADGWRDEAWDMMRTRSDCSFFMITKRPERIREHLPYDWGNGWDHVKIAVTCENAHMAEIRLPVYLELPMKYHGVMIEPMLTAVDLTPYIERWPGIIDSVSVGGESGKDARPCRYEWVEDVYRKCMAYGIGFYYHQTGARLIKDGREYIIPRKYQHRQARSAMAALKKSCRDGSDDDKKQEDRR